MIKTEIEMMLTFRRSRPIKTIDVVDFTAVFQVAQDQGAVSGAKEALDFSYFYLFSWFLLGLFHLVLFGFPTLGELLCFGLVGFSAFGWLHGF